MSKDTHMLTLLQVGNAKLCYLGAMTQREWLESVSGETSVRAVALAVGIRQPTLDRWIKTEIPPVEVVRIARHYGTSPVEALVATGLITLAEAMDHAGIRSAEVAQALREATDSQMLHELGQRLEERDEGEMLGDA